MQDHACSQSIAALLNSDPQTLNGLSGGPNHTRIIG
jgi:hypothetical protein